MNNNATYEMPWLVRLREMDPQGAAQFDVDPRRATKLDQVLSGLNSVEDKLAVIRSALAMGIDPNDDLMMLVLLAVGVQKIVQSDFRGVLHQMQATTKAANDAIEAMTVAVETMHASSGTGQSSITNAAEMALGELRTTTQQMSSALQDFTRGGLQHLEEFAERTLGAITAQAQLLGGSARDIHTVVQNLPTEFKGIIEMIDTHGKQVVEQHARDSAKFTVAQEATAISEKALTEIKTLHESLVPLRDLVASLITTAKRLGTDEKIVFKFLKASRRELAVGAMALFIGGIFGGLTTELAANLGMVGGPMHSVLEDGRRWEKGFPALDTKSQLFLLEYLRLHEHD